MSFRVTEIIDGDTFKVDPNWEWKLKDGSMSTGDTVRIANINAAEKGTLLGDKATQTLFNKINQKTVELKNAVNLSYGRIVCDVYINDEKIVL